MSNKFYVSTFHGCVYSIIKDQDSDGDYLVHTPLFADNTFCPDIDQWVEVDELALLGEERCHQEEVDRAWTILTS